MITKIIYQKVILILELNNDPISLFLKISIYIQLLCAYWVQNIVPMFLGLMENLDELLGNLAALFILNEIDNILVGWLEIDIHSV